jgi:hypothetical protein
MTYDFNYIVEKIQSAEFSSVPFRHIYIEDLFSIKHFEDIIRSQEIAPPIATNDRELIDGLYEKGYKVISFPGCITDIEEYINWHNGNKVSDFHSACEGFGMTLRLYEKKTPILRAIDKFLSSEHFSKVIAAKFEIDFADCTYDGGIQKYLDGYEISPHPDIRRKAATFMVNINPSEIAEFANHHTHFLKFKPEREYVKTYWEGNPKLDRAWVPWRWADTVYQQKKNNSIVLFSPSNDTVHGVKADYDHLETQRTQLYGNLWYKNSVTEGRLEWEELDLQPRLNVAKPKRVRLVARNLLPAKVVSIINKLRKSSPTSNSKHIGNRKI